MQQKRKQEKSLYCNTGPPQKTNKNITNKQSNLTPERTRKKQSPELVEGQK